MPLYYVDFQDGETLHTDEVGNDLADAKTAREQAVFSLPQIAKDELSFEEDRKFEAVIRDADGRLLYRATLTFHGEWIG